MADKGVAKPVVGEVLGKAGAGGKPAGRSSGKILSKAGAGGRAARPSSGEFSSKAGAGGRAARRSSGKFFYGGRSHNRVGGIY